MMHLTMMMAVNRKKVSRASKDKSTSKAASGGKKCGGVDSVRLEQQEYRARRRQWR